MGYEDNEQEIDIKEMFFHALYRWRSILLAGLVGALILGAWKCYGIVKNQAALEKAIEEGTATESDYDSKYLAAKNALNAKKDEYQDQVLQTADLKRQIRDAERTVTYSASSVQTQEDLIRTLEEQIRSSERITAEYQDALDSSVLLQTASAQPVMTAVFQVVLPDAAEGVFPDPADRVTASYRKPGTSAALLKELAKKYDLTEEQLAECYEVEPDTESDRIIIKTVGFDRKMAEELCKAVCALVESEKESIPRDHELQQVLQEYSVEKNADLINRANEIQSSIKQNINEIRSFKASIETAKSAIKTAQQNGDSAQVQLDSLKVKNEKSREKEDALAEEAARMENNLPEKIPSVFSGKKTVIKYVLIGFFVSALLLFVIYIAIYVLKPMLRIPDDIRTVFGYPVLGVFGKKMPGRICAIDKWIMKADGSGRHPDNEEVIKTAAVSIANTAEAGAKAALITSLKEDQQILAIFGKLQELVPEMAFVLLTEGVSKASNVDELSRCDAVVLLEERNATYMKKLTEDVDQIRLFHKKVLGAIVM